MKIQCFNCGFIGEEDDFFVELLHDIEYAKICPNCESKNCKSEKGETSLWEKFEKLTD